MVLSFLVFVSLVEASMISQVYSVCLISYCLYIVFSNHISTQIEPDYIPSCHSYDFTNVQVKLERCRRTSYVKGSTVIIYC